MKKCRFIKKLLSVIISIFILNSFVMNDVIYAAFQIQPIGIISQPAKIFNPDVATITDYFISPYSDKGLLVFIQDLHTNPTVQKNISKTLELLDKQYGIDRIYLEGLPSGKANIESLMALKEYDIDDDLLNKNIISGTEYYFLKNDTEAQIYGMEDWDKYFSNIQRAARIMQDQEYLEQYYNEFKQTLFSNIKNIKKIEKYINFNLTDDKLLEKINQPILQYRELHKYISLSDDIKNIDIKKIKKEHTLFIKNLKKDLPLSEYKNIVTLSKKEDLKDYYSALYEKLNTSNDYKLKYDILRRFLNFTLQKSILNAVNITYQKNKYFDDYLSSITNDKLQQDMFIVKMTTLFNDFITLAISEQDYDFFVNNYQKYINLLPHYLASDYKKYEDLLFSDTDIIFDYHDINKGRNADFIGNVSSFFQEKKGNNKVTVIIAGGFHSSIPEKLQKEKLSYLIVTPKIEGITDSSFYNEIILSSISSNKIETNALAPIRGLLLSTTKIDSNIEERFYTALLKELTDKLLKKGNITPAEFKHTIQEIKEITGLPVTTDIDISDPNLFVMYVLNEQISYRVENNKVIWQDVSSKRSNRKSGDLSATIVAKAKRKFNILEATSLQLNPNSRYASKFISRREGTKRNFMFTFSMIFSYFKLNNWAHDLMIGFASLNKNKTTKITIDFDADFREDQKNLKYFSFFKGKKIDIIIENGLNDYLSKEDIINIIAASIGRLDTRPTYFKDSLFIGYLDKSTNLFEDHLNNGFIGVNAGVFKLRDDDVKKAIIQAGLIHELTHEFKGSLNSAEYDIFEERMMFCDMKFLIEQIAKIEYGNSIDFGNLLYDDDTNERRYEHIVHRIVSTLTEEIEEPETGKKVPLFTKDVRFIRKFKNYKYNIEDILSFIKRKNFSIRERRGQLKHIENDYLIGNNEAQEKLFSGLAVFEEKEDSMEEFLEKHISKERITEVNEHIDNLIAKFRNALYSSDLDPKIRDKKVKDFEKYIHDCLNLMYRKMPNYLFGVYYNEQGVIADHALNHSIEVLNNSIPIIKFYIDEMETFDLKTLVYSAFLHDISCTLLRLNHEQNSATFAKALLKGEMRKQEIEKIYECCLGHKKIKNGILRPEHEKYFEARVLHDADGLAAALALDRILGVWLTTGETFFNRNLSIDERIRLIEENKYLVIDGGDAINDLLRQFLRRDRKYYITNEAGAIIELRSKPDELTKFLENPEVRKTIKNAGISDYAIVDAIEVINKVLNKMRPKGMKEEESETNKVNIKSFGIKERFRLLKHLVSFFFTGKNYFSTNIAVSDIHGGYTRFAELVVNLLAPQIDITNKSDEEINDIIIDRLNHIGDDTMFYLLGDLLDRGNRQVETFELVKRISETGKMKYVIGNHDLYAFMNLLGLHLPFYEKYKGIPDNYIDFRGRSINALLAKLQSKDKEFLERYNIGKEEPLTKVFWAERLEYYMEYAEQQQEEWNKKEQILQDSFATAFGTEFETKFKLDSKGKDVLNDQSTVLKSEDIPQEIKDLFSDPKFINFNKKFFGRNVGIAVYTGIRAVNKMSINWWLDRRNELEYLKDTYAEKYKDKYPKFVEYLQIVSETINDIISQQEATYDLEINTNKNITWAVIDAMMYRNYESTEWNALDWVYHKNWGGGDKGFIAQRNKKLSMKKEHTISRVSYFEDSLIQDMLKFYHDNFYLYRFDDYGICYMHSLLPVDEEGDVSLGFVDKNGIFHETDEDGKRIKGFVYKGVHYKGKNIFQGLNKIGEDIRNYKLDSDNLSEIMEALTLLTAIYADNTTRIKPANLKVMRENFGFHNILKRKGITTVVVGHNPIKKPEEQFEYTTLRFFNKEFKVINIVQIDGNMSPGYAPPKGAGLVRFIGIDGINTRGFLKGDSTEITGSVNPDVTKEVFINSIIFNVFPILKKILSLTGKIYDFIVSMRQKLSFGNIKINKRNTTVIDLITGADDIQSVAEREHINGIKNIVISPIEILNVITLIDDNQQTLTTNIDIDGVPVNIEIKTHKIKVAKGYIPAISYSYSYDKENIILNEQDIQNKIREYIIDQINNKVFDIKTTKNMFVNDSLKDTFETVSMPTTVKNIFGPILYDTRSKIRLSVLKNMSGNINIDKIKDVLAAA